MTVLTLWMIRIEKRNITHTHSIILQTGLVRVCVGNGSHIDNIMRLRESIKQEGHRWSIVACLSEREDGMTKVFLTMSRFAIHVSYLGHALPVFLRGRTWADFSLSLQVYNVLKTGETGRLEFEPKRENRRETNKLQSVFLESRSTRQCASTSETRRELRFPFIDLALCDKQLVVNELVKKRLSCFLSGAVVDCSTVF